MKTIFKILLVISFLTCFAQLAKAEVTLNPCWRMYYPHDPDHNSFNPDSVMLDTCATIDPEYPVLYAYKWYYVILPVVALNVPWAPRDSLILRDWRDIDPSFIELRNGFQMIENKFSPFIMKKQYPDETDTSSLGSRSWYIKFEEYFNIDSVVYYMSRFIDPRYVSYDMRAYRFTDNVNDKNINNDFRIELDASQTFIKILSENNLKIENIEIYNLFGELLYNYNCRTCFDNDNIAINIIKYPSGIYIIAINEKIYKFYILR